MPGGDAALAGLRAATDSLRAVRELDGLPPTDDDLSERPHLRLVSETSGLIDLLREGEPPLDFATVSAGALRVDYEGEPITIAGLESIVALKRLAGRPHDLHDLERLEEVHGPLPVIRVPGLDD